MNILGIHHITAITSSAPKIYDFFTHVLGLRLVKKTVNQDDIHTYHLYFGDDIGSPGTAMTFFDFKNILKASHANNEISKSGFRVPTDDALNYWSLRFKKYNIKHSEIKELFGRKYIDFYDFDDQPYAIFSDHSKQGVKPGIPWKKGPVPDLYAIHGLGPIFLRVSQKERMSHILTEILGFNYISKSESFHLFEVSAGGNGGSVILEENIVLGPSSQGYGGIHHVAFRVKDRESLDEWISYLDGMGVPNSGYVDRYYFESLYSRLYPGILFEFATDEPGFIDEEEDYEILGEKLTLPPFYIDKRGYVESVVKMFDTKRSDKIYPKEYLTKEDTLDGN